MSSNESWALPPLASQRSSYNNRVEPRVQPPLPRSIGRDNTTRGEPPSPGPPRCGASAPSPTDAGVRTGLLPLPRLAGVRRHIHLAAPGPRSGLHRRRRRHRRTMRWAASAAAGRGPHRRHTRPPLDPARSAPSIRPPGAPAARCRACSRPGPASSSRRSRQRTSGSHRRRPACARRGAGAGAGAGEAPLSAARGAARRPPRLRPPRCPRRPHRPHRPHRPRRPGTRPPRRARSAPSGCPARAAAPPGPPRGSSWPRAPSWRTCPRCSRRPSA